MNHQSGPKHSPEILSTSDVEWVQLALREGRYARTVGGFSPVERGLVQLPSGRVVFGKRGVDPQTTAWIQKEVAVYRWLNETGFPHAPQLLGATADTLVLPNLEEWDWSARWSSRKLQAVLIAEDALAARKPPEQLLAATEPATVTSFPESAEAISSQERWSLICSRAEAWGLAPAHRALLAACNAKVRQQWKAMLSPDHFRLNELVHIDLRADNIAFDPQSGLVQFVDWNWLERSSLALDRTLFLMSVLGDERDGISEGEFEQLCDPRAALAGACYWLHHAALDPFKPGDPDRLRPRQCTFGCRALEIVVHRGLVTL